MYPPRTMYKSPRNQNSNENLKPRNTPQRPNESRDTFVFQQTSSDVSRKMIRVYVERLPVRDVMH
jgi:hypothetical protein